MQLTERDELLERNKRMPHFSILLPLEGSPMLTVGGESHPGDSRRLVDWIQGQPRLQDLIGRALAIRDESSLQ